MLPRISRIRTGLSRKTASRPPIAPRPRSSQICPLCTFSQTPRRAPRTTRSPADLQQHRAIIRRQSHHASQEYAKNLKGVEASRGEIRAALLNLQKNAANYINTSRLQLALRGLEQPPGNETIRIAILGVADGGSSLKKAKQLLRLLLADPLKEEEEWERILLNSSPGARPLLIRVGHDEEAHSGYSSRMVEELHVSSPTLNGHKLEFLVLETDPPKNAIYPEEGFPETVLVPTMEIPTSSTGRYTPVTTPVHKALVVSHGLIGVGSVLSILNLIDKTIVHGAVDLPPTRHGEVDDEGDPLPFQIIDVDSAAAAVSSFRESVGNALDYERRWSSSGVPEVLEWLRVGTSPVEGDMKLPLCKLIGSVIENTGGAINAEKDRHLSTVLATKISAPQLKSIMEELSMWAERAHTELRDDLDIAFRGHRWRQLKWWKLFWRSDDVSMVTNDILADRFLINADKEIIFLSGRMAEAGVLDTPSPDTHDWAYKPEPHVREEQKLGAEPPGLRLIDIATPEDGPRDIGDHPWPQGISVTRRMFIDRFVPPMEALANRLVLRALSVSVLTSAAGILGVYCSANGTIYDIFGIAAAGIVWSLRHMQTKWEPARKTFEDEVREKGRIAIKNVAEDLEYMLKKAGDKPLDEQDQDLKKAQRAVKRAKIALLGGEREGEKIDDEE